MRWRLEAIGCALVGATSGVAIVAGALLRQERKAAANIRVEAHAPDGWLDEKIEQSR